MEYYDMNDRPAAVRELQKYLRRIGHDKNGLPLLLIDGVYDDRTRRAVVDFQRAEGIAATGRVDRETWDRIYDVYRELGEVDAEGVRPFPTQPEQAVLNRSTVGDAVIILKMMLRTLAAYYDEFGEIGTDGVYDETTEQAVRDFQRKNGLEPTGETDVQTWNRIAGAYNRSVNRYDQ